jgi:uncharacterized DUF497 family protein
VRPTTAFSRRPAAAADAERYLLVVVYTYKEPDVIRLISAWKANKRQRNTYEKGRS